VIVRTLVLALLLLAVPAHAGPEDSVARGAERYSEALEAFSDDPVLARSLFAEAAAAFERAISEGAPANAELYRALGNAYTLAGEPGRAILAYRRALLHAPFDRRSLDALEMARASIAIETPTSPSRHLLDVINIWPRYVPIWIMRWCFALAWAALWTVLLVVRLRQRPLPLAAVTALAVIIAATGVALGAKSIQDRNLHDVVILTTTTGYNGPSSEVYEPTFEQPLVSGIEARLIERRNQWAQIELRDGSRTWVPASTFEPVRPMQH